MLDINKAIQDIGNALDNLFTSDEERLKYQDKLVQIKLQMYEMQMELSRELIKQNTEIGKVSWVGRWPQILGILGVAALFIDLVLRPILSAWGIHFIDIDESKIVAMLMKIMGVSY